MRKAELLQMLRMGAEIETYRKDKVPTLKGGGQSPAGGTDREPMTQQSLEGTGEG